MYSSVPPKLPPFSLTWTTDRTTAALSRRARAACDQGDAGHVRGGHWRRLRTSSGDRAAKRHRGRARDRMTTNGGSRQPSRSPRRRARHGGTPGRTRPPIAAGPPDSPGRSMSSSTTVAPGTSRSRSTGNARCRARPSPASYAGGPSTTRRSMTSIAAVDGGLVVPRQVSVVAPHGRRGASTTVTSPSTHPRPPAARRPSAATARRARQRPGRGGSGGPGRRAGPTVGPASRCSRHCRARRCGDGRTARHRCRRQRDRPVASNPIPTAGTDRPAHGGRTAPGPRPGPVHRSSSPPHRRRRRHRSWTAASHDRV